MVAIYIMPVLGITTIISSLVISAIGFGLTLLANKLTAKRPKGIDAAQQTLAQRGSPIPRVIGRRRVGYVFAWIGPRLTNPSSGGKGTGGTGSGSGTQLSQNAWHQICLGPADTLWGIYVNGKKLGLPIITRGGTPSGSMVNVAGIPAHTITTHFGTTINVPAASSSGNTFQIYWGECNQPQNSFLGDTTITVNGNPTRPGVPSRWPRCMYIVWRSFQLGSSPFWPQIEYEIECRVNATNPTLVNSDPWIAETIPTTYSGGVVLVLGTQDDGANAAHVLWSLITGPSPDGAGLDPKLWLLNVQSFEDLGVALAAEHLPINMTIGSSSQAQTDQDGVGVAIASILDEIGAVMYYDNGQLTVRLVRQESGPLPSIIADINSSPDPEEEKIHGDFTPNRVIYTIDDKTINFNQYPLGVDDDAAGLSDNRTRWTNITLNTITDRTTGYKVAERKDMELSTQRQTFKFTGSRDARYMVPGQAFNLNNLGQMRVATVFPNFLTGTTAVIECLLDQYSLVPSGFLPPDGQDGGGLISNESADPDLFVQPFVIPRQFRKVASEIEIGIARVRANESVDDATIWVSTDNITFVNIGNQTKASAGGTLNAPILDTTSSPIVDYPSITAYNDFDMLALPDFTGNPGWTTGLMTAIICNTSTPEALAVQSVAVVDGGYQPTEMIRNLFNINASDPATGSLLVTTHVATTPIVFFKFHDIVRLTSTFFMSGATLYFKTVPQSGSEFADITSITSVSLTIDANESSSLTLTNPIGGDTIANSTTYSITWLKVGLTGGIDIYYSADSGTTWTLVVSNTADTGSYSWSVPATTGTTSMILIRSHSHPTITDQSTYVFSIV